MAPLLHRAAIKKKQDEKYVRILLCRATMNNVLEIGPNRNEASRQFLKDSERTKRNMLIFCMVLIFAYIFMTFGRHLLDR